MNPIKAVAAGLVALASTLALADGGGRPGPTNATYQAECGGSCHVAFPPRALDASTWGRVMDSLARHYGTDATVEPAQEKEIRDFLQLRAGGKARSSDPSPQPRVTATEWFRKEHRELDGATWKRASIRSAANCGACHTEAERGDYRERGIRIPR